MYYFRSLTNLTLRFKPIFMAHELLKGKKESSSEHWMRSRLRGKLLREQEKKVLNLR